MDFYSLTKKLTVSFNSNILKDMEPDPEHFLQMKKNVIHPIKYEFITSNGIGKAVLRTKCSYRSPGMDAGGSSRIFTFISFDGSSISLCKAFAKVIKKLC